MIEHVFRGLQPPDRLDFDKIGNLYSEIEYTAIRLDRLKKNYTVLRALSRLDKMVEFDPNTTLADLVSSLLNIQH